MRLKKHFPKTKLVYLFIILLVVLPMVFNSSVSAQAPTWNGYTQLSGTQLRINWNQVPNASSYKIYRTTNQELQKHIATINNGTTVTYTDNTISELVLYHYEITAIINGTESALSVPLTIRTVDMTNPNAVTISSPQKGGNWIQLQWNASTSPDVHHYEIYRGGTRVGVVNRGTPTVSYSDVGLSGSTAYSYHVVTVDNSGRKSANSNTLSVTTNVMNSAEKFIETFTSANANRWTNNGIAWLTFPVGADWNGRAQWHRSGSGLNAATANADQLSTSAFSISPSEVGLPFTLTFDYRKGWSNSENRSGRGQDHRLRLFYKNTTATGTGAWGTAVWQDLTVVQLMENTAQVNITFPSAGNYHFRFEGTIATSDRGSDISYIHVDNIRLERPIPAPSAPVLDQIETRDGTRIDLSWSEITGQDVVGYQVFRSTTGDSPGNYTLYSTTSSNIFTDPNVPHGAIYHYQIVAVNSSGLLSLRSNPQMFDNREGEIDLTPPERPTNLTSSLVSSTRIELQWNASPSTNVSEYIIWQSSNGGATYTNVGRTSTPFFRVESGLQVLTTYTFRVMTVDEAGNYSAGSNPFTVTIPEPDLQPPSTPGNFRVHTVGQDSIEFVWDHSTDNVAVHRYEIQMLVDGNFITQKIELHPVKDTVIDKLKPDTPYQFRVIAFDTSNNQSLPSNILEVTTDKDNTPPIIKLRKPYQNATGVGTRESMLVRFDDDMNFSTVTNQTFIVRRQSDNQVVAGTFNFSNPKEIKFTPNSALNTTTTYIITLTAEIKNVSGLSVTPSSWSFETGTSQFTKPHGNYSDNTALCSTCHHAHTGEGARLINKKKVNQVCFVCHDGTGSLMNVETQFGTQQTPKLSIHPVFTPSQEEQVEISCASCHNPHDAGKDLNTGNNLPSLKRLLSSYNKGSDTVIPTNQHEGNQFCWTCHGNTNNPTLSFGFLDDFDRNGVNTVKTTPSVQVNVYRTDHQTNFPADNKGHNSTKMDGFKENHATGTNIKCVACHEKHGSDAKPLLRTNIGSASADKNGKEFCYQCHQEKVEFAFSNTFGKTQTSEDNYDGMAINEARGHSQFDCQVCHNPHGSPYPKYLRLPYRMDTGQVAYNASQNLLCFDCHDENKLRTMGGRVRGDRENLHDFHLRDSKIRATCKNCHRPHGAIATEQTGTAVNHRVGFPNRTVGGSRRFDFRDNNRGGCNLSCHGRSHDSFGGNFWYGGALRNSGNSNNWALKNNWQTESWLLNNRPDAYKFGNNNHFRDGGLTPNNGYIWK